VYRNRPAPERVIPAGKATAKMERATNPVSLPKLKFRPRLGITTVLVVGITVLIAVLMTITTWLEVRRQHDIFIGELEVRAVFIADVVQSAMAAPLAGQDLAAMAKITEIIVDLPDLRKMDIYSPDGRVIMEIGEDEASDHEVSGELRRRALDEQMILKQESGHTIEVAAPIVIDSEIVGGVSFLHDTTGADVQARKTAIQAIWQTALLMLGGIVVAYLFAQRMVKPLHRLVQAIRRVGDGDLEFVSKRHITREIGEISEAFEEMTSRLRLSKFRLESQADALSNTNLKLEFEIAERSNAESSLRSVHRDLREAHDELELRVTERTAELVEVNASLEEEIAERARTEREIDSVYALTPDLLCILDASGNLRRVNPAFTRLFGSQSDALKRAAFAELAHPEDRANVDLVLTELAGQSDSIAFENRWLAGNGEYRWLAWNIVSVADDRLMYAAGRDITDRVSVEQMKDEFVSTVSHELRTPLTAIRGSLGLIAGNALGEVPDSMKEMVDIAVINSERLVRLVNDILDVQKLESGMISLKLESFNIDDLMSGVARELSVTAAAAGTTIEVNPGEVNSQAGGVNTGAVFADPHRLAQALTNLVGNAIKFSSEGGTIRVGAAIKPGADKRGDMLRVTVSDEGRGVPSDMLESIFGKFEQVDATDSREQVGTGLGLTICRGIIGQHGGRIWAENASQNAPQNSFGNTKSSGTVFIFEIPRNGPVKDSPQQTSPRELNRIGAGK
jgi:PAS domain S-box-containing protein